jgi:sulfite exporter TauE/SafE
MHCAACELLIGEELGGAPGVAGARASLKDNAVIIEGSFGDRTPETLARELTERIKAHGYTLSVERNEKKGSLRDFKIAVPIALGFMVLFVLLQKMGLVHLVGGGNLGYGAVFLIGVIASLSTCMAVVGGLVLSLSATYAKEGNALVPQTLFHVGRIVSFFVLGGIIGAIGTAFTLSSVATFVLGMVIGIVMLILGVNLLDVFHGTKRLQLSMPAFLSRHALQVTKVNHTLTPLLVGVVTFFLPCGFTQSMQLYTLGTGGFIEGGLTMFFFALGTFPALALLSFGSLSIAKGPYAGVFYKTAGLIVIGFALMNIINSLVVMGYLAPVFTF